MAFKIPTDTAIPTSKEQIASWALAKEEIHNLEAGDGLNCLVAEKIFGFTRCLEHVGDDQFPCYRNPPEPYSLKVRPFSDGLELAMEAAEKAKIFDDTSISLGKDMLGRFILVARGQCEETLIACGDTAPLAICKALLILDFDAKHPVVRPAVTYIKPITKIAFAGSGSVAGTARRDRFGRGAYLGGNKNKSKKEGGKGKKGR